MSESDFIPYQAVVTCPPGPALVLAPHPDDEVFGCGGAILAHLAAGDQVSIVILTDSDYGHFAAGIDGRAERRREAIAAGAVLGYGEPAFWGLADRQVTYDEGLIDRVLAELATTAAACLYAPSWWEIHPDHSALALVAAEAVRRCPRPVTLVMYEVGVPLHPNRLLDITKLAGRKQAAMACFESQLRIQRYDEHLMALHRFRTYSLPAEVKFAEAFRLVDQAALRQDPLRVIRPGIYYAQGFPTSGLAIPLVSALFIGGPAGLADALDSVMIQTHAHLEILVIADRGEDILNQATDVSPWRSGRFPLRVVATREALSLAERANLAMAHARGEWLVFLADGDSLEANHVSSLVAVVGTVDKARCACAGVRLELSQPGEVSECQDWFLAPAPRGLADYASVPLNAVLLARSLYAEGCHFDTDLDEGLALWDFWLQVSIRTPWVTTPALAARQRKAVPSGLNIQPRRGDASAGVLPVIHRWLKGTSREEVALALQGSLHQAEQSLEGYKGLQHQVVALETEYQQATYLLGKLQEKLAVRERQLDEVQDRAAEKAALSMELRREIEALRSSTCWRWTRPLRLLGMLRRRAVLTVGGATRWVSMRLRSKIS